MSYIENALGLKRSRAKIVVQNIVEHCNALKNSKTKEEVFLGKKMSRMVQGLVTQTDKAENDLEFLRKFYEYIAKISKKLIDFDADGSIFDKDVEWVDEIKPIVVFDIDDTLRDASHRMHIRKDIEKMKEDASKAKEDGDFEESQRIRELIDARWQDFFIAGFDDTPKEDVIGLCNMYYELGFEVKIRTGASALYQERTEKHLKEMGVKYHELRMRKVGVRIPDYRLKPSWISKYDLGQNVFATYDDREPLNEGFQKKGVVNTVLVNKEFDAEKHLAEIKPLIEKQISLFKVL